MALDGAIVNAQFKSTMRIQHPEHAIAVLTKTVSDAPLSPTQ